MERNDAEWEATSDALEGEATPAENGTDDAVLTELRGQLEETQAKADSYLDQLRRSVAEFSNYKKRIEREAGENQKYAAAGVLGRLLPVIDDFDRALDNLPADLQGHAWVGGIVQIREKLTDLLRQEGVSRIEAEGSSFDPQLHDALTYEPSQTHAEGEIIGVLRAGYRIGERVLRPAQVRVARRADDAS